MHLTLKLRLFLPLMVICAAGVSAVLNATVLKQTFARKQFDFAVADHWVGGLPAGSPLALFLSGSRSVTRLYA